ncbi:MAG: energy transducer TonB [Bacteroidia bacterium]|nr:energy transducer TonB [Bacteroidia bacterium]
MKQFFAIIFITISFINYTYSQTEQKTDSVIIMPEFPGGQDAMMDFIGTNIRYPTYAKEKGIEGKVFIRFIISKTGKVDSVTVLKGVYPLLDEEAIRVVAKMPDWKPGMQDGKPVNVSFHIPINFKLNKKQELKYDTSDSANDIRKMILFH